MQALCQTNALTIIGMASMQASIFNKAQWLSCCTMDCVQPMHTNGTGGPIPAAGITEAIGSTRSSLFCLAQFWIVKLQIFRVASLLS